MDRRILACAASMAAGVNFLPWTGPMIRSASSLKIPVASIFNPLLPVQAIGMVFVFGCAWCSAGAKAAAWESRRRARGPVLRRELDERNRRFAGPDAFGSMLR